MVSVYDGRKEEGTGKVKPMPQISVIIPTYNRERFVIKAIGSVLNQNFRDYEIIIVDDGSTDDTRRVLSRYGGKIRYLYQPNSGVSSARNAGIKEARGKWVAFLDSDDEWTEDYLSAQTAQIRKFPNAVAHMTNVVRISNDEERYNYFAEIGLLGKFGSEPYLVFKRPLRLVVKRSCAFLSATIVRKDVLVQAGLFDTHLSIAEDVDLVARVVLRGALTANRRQLVKYIRREEPIVSLVGMSLKRGIYRFRSFDKVYANLLCYGDLTWLERATIARALSSNRRALGNALVMAGRKVEARQSYRESLFVYPSVQSLIKFVATFLPGRMSRFLVRTGRHILPGDDAT